MAKTREGKCLMSVREMHSRTGHELQGAPWRMESLCGKLLAKVGKRANMCGARIGTSVSPAMVAS